MVNLLLAGCLCSFVAAKRHQDVVLDLGSSGTRAYLFTSELPAQDKPCLSEVLEEITSEGIARAHATSSAAFEAYLEKLRGMFEKMKHTLEDRQDVGSLEECKFLMLATAGMRQYPHHAYVWPKVRELALAVFGEGIEGNLKTENIPGDVEALYGSLAINYLARQEIQASMDSPSGKNTTVPSTLPATGRFGSYDLGGASVQPTFPLGHTGDSVYRSYNFGAHVAYEAVGGKKATSCNFVPGNDPSIVCNGIDKCGEQDISATCLEEIEAKLGGPLLLGDRIAHDFSAITPEDWDTHHLVAMSTFAYAMKYLKLVGFIDSSRDAFTQAEFRVAAQRLSNSQKIEFTKKGSKGSTYPRNAFYLSRRVFDVNYMLKLLQWLGVPEEKEIIFRSKINGAKTEWALGAVIEAYDPVNFTVSNASDFAQINCSWVIVNVLIMSFL